MRIPFLHAAAITFLLMGAAGLLMREIALQPDGRLHAHVLSIGQGDSIFLVSPSGAQILIDGGVDLSPLEEIGKRMPFFDRTIELVVLTHPNTDHMTVFPELLKRYTVKQVLLSGVQFDLGLYEAMLEEIDRAGIPVILADPAKDIVFDDGLILDIIWPPRTAFGSKPKESNDASIVMRAMFGTGSILLTGDIEEPAESAILASGADVRSTVLKVAHHGSRTSSSTGFLLAVDPQLAVMSLGAGNSYGHPHQEVLDRFRHFGIPVQRTDLDGSVEIVF